MKQLYDFNRFIHLDILRGVLAILVVFHHMPDHWFSNSIILSLKQQLYVSVDYFFLLSGFLISYKYRVVNISFLSFIKKRFFRLFPLLAFSSVVFSLLIIIKFFLFKATNDSQVFNYTFFDFIVSFVDNIIFASSTNILGNLNLINTPAWSVSAEMICYFIFAIQLSMRFNLRLFISIFCFLLFLFILYRNETFFSTSNYGFARGYIGFFCGTLLANFYPRFFKSNLINFFLSIFFFSVLVYTCYQNKANFFIDLLCFCLIFLSFLFFLNVNLKFENLNFQTKKIVYLGLISYSIYLNHFIVILCVDKLFGQVMGNYLLVILSYIIIIYLSVFTFKFVESKFRIR